MNDAIKLKLFVEKVYKMFFHNLDLGDLFLRSWNLYAQSFCAYKNFNKFHVSVGYENYLNNLEQSIRPEQSAS